MFLLRDYPTPMLEIRDWNLWGRFIGAEQVASKRGEASFSISASQVFTCDVTLTTPCSRSDSHRCGGSRLAVGEHNCAAVHAFFEILPRLQFW